MAELNGGIEELLNADISPFRLAQGELANVDADFLDAAQSTHDQITYWSDGVFDVKALDAVAADWDLQVVIDEPERAPEEVLVAV